MPKIKEDRNNKEIKKYKALNLIAYKIWQLHGNRPSAEERSKATINKIQNKTEKYIKCEWTQYSFDCLYYLTIKPRQHLLALHSTSVILWVQKSKLIPFLLNINSNYKLNNLEQMWQLSARKCSWMTDFEHTNSFDTLKSNEKREPPSKPTGLTSQPRVTIIHAVS